jgi:S1-C subfamily serine protease
MSPLDWIIVAFAALLGLQGFRVGLVAGVFSLGGALAGLYLGSRLASSLLSGGLPPAYGTLIPLFAVIVSVLLGQALARTVGEKLRLPLLGTLLEPLDKLGGAVLGAAVGLVFAWVVGVLGQQAPLPPILQTALQRSEVVKELDERLPSRALLQAFSRLDPLPQIEGPRPEVAAPDPELLEDPRVQQVAPSVVRVVGASGITGSAGSGWVAAPGLVVTNAHVVADSQYVAVQPEGVGAQLEAEVLVFDERNDLAVLRVEDLNLPALELAVPERGESVAVLGYPENGPFGVQAGRVGVTQRVLTNDIRGRGPVERQVTSLRSSVRQGNSGGPAVDSDGRVVATIFAERVGEEGIAYGIPSPIVEEAVAEAEEQLSPAATTARWLAVRHIGRITHNATPGEMRDARRTNPKRRALRSLKGGSLI